MQDPPGGAYMLGLVSAFLRNEVMPQLSGSLAFQVRVAANAVDLARREFELAPAADAAERAGLAQLLGADGELEAQNAALCDRIRAGDIDLDTPGLVDHLRRTMLAKLAVDQPNYSAYDRARQAWGENDTAA
jgi:hypothetical protein